jgi:aminoglycoside phosphotransferase (APT) family kinase protein
VREPPTDDELLAVLDPVFPGRVAALQRAPYRYATSHALEELHVGFDDGSTLTLLLKDLAWDRLLPEAARGKPRSLHDPRREIAAYREVLAPLGVGPRCHHLVDGPTDHWLFLEKVNGVELWQVGEPDVWDDVAAWLGWFHGAVDAAAARRLLPWLLRRDRDDLQRWADAAARALESSDDPRSRALGEVLGRVPQEPMARSAQVVFLHGEFYPSNVLVGVEQDPLRIWPIDWEMAATGPGAFDLAALTTGWDEPVRLRMVGRYRDALSDPPALEDLLRQVDICRFHLALQWIGWASRWQAPAEHAHDWVGEGLDAAARLGW